MYSDLVFSYLSTDIANICNEAALIAARQRGASRAVLFTSNPSAARSYEALGFRRLGDYGLILFK